MSTMSHWIGLAGEAANLVGALVLTRDLLSRRRDHERLKDYQSLSEWATAHNLDVIYKNLKAKDPDFAAFLLAWEASRLGLRGLMFLVVGFVLLAIYHMLEIIEAS